MHTKRLCPGSHALSAKYPETGPSSPKAIDGTHSHTLLEVVLRASLQEQRWLKVSDWIGSDLSDHEGKFRIAADRAYRVQRGVDYIASRVDSLPNAELYTEIQVDPGAMIGRTDWKGTADVVIVSDSVLEVIDYKDGSFPVWPDDNDQIDSYKIGAVNSLYNPPETIIGTIIQPKDTTPVKVGKDIPLGELLDRLPEFVAIIQACEDPNAPRIPGKDQCMFCPGKIDERCPEYVAAGTSDLNQLVASIGPGDSGGVDLLADINGPDDQATGLTAPESIPLPIFPEIDGRMSNEQLSQVLDAIGVARQWFKEAEKEAAKRIRLGQEIPFYKAVAVNSPRKWNPEMSTEDIVKKLSGMKIKKAECTKLVLVSFNDVLKHPGLTDRQVTRIKKELITAPGSSDNFKVVPTSSKGEALDFKQQDLIDGIVPPEEVSAGEAEVEDVSFI